MDGSQIEALVGATLAYNLLAKRTIFATKFGLTKEQTLVMNALELSGPIWISELSNRLAVSKEQASRAVSALEKQGLVLREPVQSDRRAVTVSLTSEGRAFLEESHAEMDRLLEGNLEKLSDDEAHELSAAAETSMKLLLKALC